MITERHNTTYFNGTREIDSIIQGLHPGQLITIASRPAIGKTTFAINLAINASKSINNRIVYFSLELSAKEVSKRLSSIIIEDKPVFKVSDIENHCKKLHTEFAIGMVIIDYVQLLNKGHERSLTEIICSLKSMAEELNVPVVVLSQLGRGPENRIDRRPRVTDLDTFGRIKDYSDLVILLYRDEIYNLDSKDKGLLEVIIATNESGLIGTFKIDFSDLLSMR